VPGPRGKSSGARVDDWWRAGRAALPKIAVDRGSFGEFVGAHDIDPDLAADVYLACGCARRVPEALAAFEAGIGPALDRVIRRASSDAAQWDDMRQLVRERLFVGRAGAPGKIAHYSGRAPLQHWVRVVAVRVVRSAQRKRTETPVEDDAVFDEILESRTAEDAVSDAHLLRTYKEAFERAFAELDAPARTLLRLSVVDRLGIDELARLLNVHRATAARRLVAAREQLARSLTDHVRREAKLSPSEAASAVRAIQSKIDLSLSRVMRDAGDV
jgi:RNA polymerase sigma-70 factor (ECF subfamily)